MNRHPEVIRGEAVRYDELRVGDRILDAGEVTYVHVFNGGHYVRVLTAPLSGTSTIGEVADAGNSIHRAALKVTVATPRLIDLDGRYAVDGYPGIAFYLLGYDVGEVDDDGFVDTDYEYVRATMVGDDYVHIVAVDDLEPLEDDDYCSQCGQIGCGHDGR